MVQKENEYLLRIELIALLLSLIGALNWGLIGAWDFDLVVYVLGDNHTMVKTTYILVGLSALFLLSVKTLRLIGKMLQ